ncbi:Major facilitator superfamily transporter [Aphelenchoides besseyi]|nr:Major facilitator superfamily transporter [Aphelenchoides besseyi]KAI6200571.1 Major facilitator superfamily transporter [Aphelenchoides besseyi]
MELKEHRRFPLFHDRYRYFILLISLLCLTSISSNMLTFNFAIICMATPKNMTEAPLHSTYDFTATETSSLIWAVAVGSMIATFPFSIGYNHYGAQHVFVGAGLLSIISTAITPLAIYLGYYYFLSVRFLQGVSYAADFAAIGMIITRWSSLKQHAFYISVLTCYSPLSSTLTNSVSGFICSSSLGWPFIYYFHALVGCLLFGCWAIFYNDHPKTNNYVSPVELEKIERGKEKEQLDLSIKIPYLKIVTNPVVLTVWLNAFAEISSAIFLLTYTPLYLRNVHGFSIKSTGLLSSLPTTLNMPTRILLGYVSDKIKFISEPTKLKIFNTFSVFGPALCYAAISFTPQEEHEIAVALLSGVSIFYAGTAGGFYKAATKSCLQFSHFVIASIQFIKCITLFLAPLLVAIFVQDLASPASWRKIFLIFTISQTVAAALFLWLGTDKPQDFTRVAPPQKRKCSLMPSVL